ncbi:DUF6114 domain-containing protein [Streptomyces sp. NBC_01006]|uniref:DUF6114 domain-containing protein n=1 Tax=Streptomyces sp. NBC_01006 TaxID=2903716 RepID=UPI00386985AF|nr:DUF6114 domain-containing protein [Streptomyces sp. NBC_01006]
MNPQAPVRAADDAWLTAVYHRFHAWSGGRPFWAGLFTLIGGVPIAYFPYADLRLGNVTIAMATTAGAGSLIIGILLITLGLALWFQQGIRVFAGVASILLALVSLPVSNLGGFFLGFLFALVGGALALSWAPGKPEGAAQAKAEFVDGPLGVPGPRDTETAYATETTAHADGGRNSAG